MNSLEEAAFELQKQGIVASLRDSDEGPYLWVVFNLNLASGESPSQGLGSSIQGYEDALLVFDNAKHWVVAKPQGNHINEFGSFVRLADAIDTVISLVGELGQ